MHKHGLCFLPLRQRGTRKPAGDVERIVFQRGKGKGLADRKLCFLYRSLGVGWSGTIFFFYLMGGKSRRAGKKLAQGMWMKVPMLSVWKPESF